MAQSADPVFEALGLSNQPETCQEQLQMPEQYQAPPDYMNPMQMQQQMQMQFQSQIQQQVMYQVQQHVQQHIQQQMQQSAAGEPGASAQEAAFKNPESICAFAAAATAAALVYFQATGMAPPAPQQQLLLPEVLPAAPACSTASSTYGNWGMAAACPTVWQAPAWYTPGEPIIPPQQEQAPPASSGSSEEAAPRTPVKTHGDSGIEGIITPSPVPLDAPHAYMSSPPMVLKLSEVVSAMGERSPTTTASERPSDHCAVEAGEENAGAMLLQLLKGGNTHEEEPIEEEPWVQATGQEESWNQDWSAWDAEPKQRRRRRKRGAAAEGQQTPSTVASDGERQALASSGQELLRQLRAGAAAKEAEVSKQTYVRRAKNGDVRIFDRI